MNCLQATGWGATVMDEHYTYDVHGNRVSRQSGGFYAATETYSYTADNRLKKASLSDGGTSTTTLTASYDAAGNFQSRTDRGGSLAYGYQSGQGADRLASVSGHLSGSFGYDAAGRITGGPDGLSAEYNARGLATVLHKRGHTAALAYAPDGHRYRSVLDATTTEYYIAGGAFRIVQKSGVTTYREAVVVGGVTVAQLTTRSNATDTFHYFFHDALGSVVAVTGPDGAAHIEHLAYGPYGEMRQGSDWTTLMTPPAILSLNLPTRRGYTGGEALTALGLVHLGARIYDPTLGRFLSPDPAGASVPYVYVGDNPMSDTDPSGQLSVGQIVTIAALALATYFTGGALAPVLGSYIAAATATGAIMGFAGGMIASDANLHAGLMGALAGAAGGATFSYLGGAGFYSEGVGGTMEKAALEGFAGGALSDVEGGSFRDGFLGAFAGAVSEGAVDEIPGEDQGAIFERTAATAALAGTASKLTGGSFANGAETAAFLRLFGETAKYFEHNVGGKATLAPGKNPDNPYYKRSPVTGQQPATTWDNNVFGNNEPGHLCSQGSTCSRIFNLVPGLNGGVARLHDYWLNSMEVRGLNVTAIDNVSTMLPAAVVGYAAIIGTPLQVLSTQQIIYLSIASNFDRDDRRHDIYYGAAIGAK